MNVEAYSYISTVYQCKRACLKTLLGTPPDVLNNVGKGLSLTDYTTASRKPGGVLCVQLAEDGPDSQKKSVWADRTDSHLCTCGHYTVDAAHVSSIAEQ
jgi:hypothetical protein